MLHSSEHGFSSSIVTASAPDAPKGSPVPKAPRAAERKESAVPHPRILAKRLPLSMMDAATGYPAVFVEHLDAILTYHREKGGMGAVITIAIENLAMVMSGYGSELTEQVIRSLEEEIATLLGEKDAICRLQKDILAIVLTHTSDEECAYLCERIDTQIQGFGSRSALATLHLMALVAPVTFTTQYAKAVDVIDASFISLREHRGISAPAPGAPVATAEFSRQEMGLANYLNRAIHEDRLRMAYQPIIDSATGETSHYEALLRVVGDDGTISSAGALIPIAERMGLIHVIDRLVLEKVFKELLRSPTLHLSFNVSNLTTGDSRWLDDLKRLVADHPDITSRMVVEITETAAHRDLSKTAYFVAAIQALGAQVALDDFGSGYTSFRQLKTLSVDFVKIDGAFIRDLVDNADNRFFVKTLLDFTKGFGLKAVAEFVESGEVAKMLMELGVEYMQGYYFGRPYNHRVWLKDDE